jgi:NADH:ubiquinone oxidoreductase subunit
MEVAKRPRLHSKQCATAMKRILLTLFTWWDSQTFGTMVTTWLYGEAVGDDEFGNHYYRTRGGKIDPALGFERRWVVYNGYADATTIPPSWHGWMHHTVDTPPTQQNYRPQPGSTLAAGRRPKATGDYKAWTPER